MASERSAEIQDAASLLFDEILKDIVLDTTIAAHREIKRGRVVCGVCGTRCRSHNPLSSTQPPHTASSQSSIPSRAPSPLPPPSSSSTSTSFELQSQSQPISRTAGYLVGPEKGTGGSTGIGSGSGRMDSNGNVFFACLVCDRQVVSSKYAPHLSGCLGFNGSTRRTASRSAAAVANAKARLGTDGKERSSSPYVASDAGDSDDGGGGGSTPSKKNKALLNGNGKRGISPKKAGIIKKARLGSTGGTPSPLPRATLPPSKLGRPPTTAPSSARRSSASTSPGASVISLPESSETGGTTSRKTLPIPGAGIGGTVIITYDSDDADDY